MDHGVGPGRALDQRLPVEYVAPVWLATPLAVRASPPSSRVRPTTSWPRSVHSATSRRPRTPVPPALPPRQREALAVALDAGSYDAPREATHDDVADRIDCAPSTASEHLRKAERRVVRTLLNRHG